jgi:hypothetical protein
MATDSSALSGAFTASTDTHGGTASGAGSHAGAVSGQTSVPTAADNGGGVVNSGK